jgi:hypothetical protein
MRGNGEKQDVTDASVGQEESGPVKEARAEKANESKFANKDGAIVSAREGQDPNEVTFDGPNDSFDPLTQPIWRKWVSVFTVASGAICV